MDWKSLKKIPGFNSKSVSLAEKAVSTIGAFIGIALIAFVSFQFTNLQGAALIIPSMGASAVLLFAVPHGKLSQPWSLFGGHIVSAVIGVACSAYIPDLYISAGLAVGLSIAMMHLLNCIHPPGGATALAAVVGGAGIHALGFNYVLTPILLNVVIIFLVAIIFNNFFPWRRYPVSMMRFVSTPKKIVTSATVSEVDVQNAIQTMNIIVDVTDKELVRLCDLALQYASENRAEIGSIIIGHYYTNNKRGLEWSVRQIIDEQRSENTEHDIVIYRIVEGQGLRSSGSCTRKEFAAWAAKRLISN